MSASEMKSGVPLHPIYLILTTRVLEKYYVGELITNELPVFPKPG